MYVGWPDPLEHKGRDTHMNIDLGRARVRRVLQSSVALVLVGGVVVASLTPAAAAPEKVLQSVAITLGSDATIEGVASTTVRAGDGEQLSSDSASLDPGAVSGDLPVRVLTSYRLGDRSGTDLADIEGESGRVVVDVTVQNVTARPEQLGYDVNGTQLRQNALVATPLTVVASADLGEDGLGTVVTTDDVTPADVTNGVLGRSGDGADVQWAAMLAPPRLGSSATFRLVQDTDDFEVPTFDLSVQPGLVTDPSVQQLLEAAFSEDPSSTLRLETATIELVSDVNATLTTASAVLGQIRRELGTTAATLGQKTISDLQSSAALVSSSLSALAGDMDSLSSQMSGEMERASDDTVAQFRDTVDRMKDLLGDPGKFDEVPDVPGATCEEGLPELTTRGSITRQMMGITAHLGAISVATEDCKNLLKAGLLEAVGDQSATAGDGTVIGSVMQTQATLVTQAGQLRAKGAEIAGIFDSRLLTGANQGVAALQSAMFGAPDDDRDGLHGTVNRLKGGNSALQQELERILADIDVLLGVPGTGSGELTVLQGQLDTVVSQLDAAVARLSVDDNVAARGLLLGVRDEVCAGDDPDNRNQPADRLSEDLVGVPCGVAVDGPDDLEEKHDDVKDRVAASQSRIEDALTALQPAQEQAKAARDAVEEAGGQLEEVRDAVDDLQGAPARDLIAQLQELMPSISEGGVTERDCAVVADPARTFEPPLTPEESRTDSVEAIVCHYGALYSNQKDIDDDAIRQIFEASAVSLDGLKDQLGSDVSRIDAERRDAERRVDEVVDTLTAALDQSAESIRTEGQRSVTRQRAQLEAEQQQLARGLDQRITEAVRRIEGTVADSNRNLVAAERALRADLDEVLLDLGTREADGTGLLGALVKGAADTGTATDSVLRANAATSEFAGVRSTALADVFLQQAQLSRSLELLETYPAFGEDLPEGSSHLTVFSFEIGGR